MKVVDVDNVPPKSKFAVRGGHGRIRVWDTAMTGVDGCEGNEWW